ncbi:MAG: hypothetical protein ACERKN_16780 [Velocimicrobium sp.]|nr:hypothetical protein [Lachnospiraceae bacterium]
MGVKVNLNTKGILKDLERQMQKNPEIFVKQNAGKEFEGACPKCGHVGIIFTQQGDAECPVCKARIKIELNF